MINLQQNEVELNSNSTEFYILKVMYNRQNMIPEIAQKLKGDDFFNEAHRYIFGAITRLSYNGEVSAEGIMTLLESQNKRGYDMLQQQGGVGAVDGMLKDHTMPETPSVTTQIETLKGYTYRRNAISTAEKIKVYAMQNMDFESGKQFESIGDIDKKIKENIYALQNSLNTDEVVEEIGKKAKEVREMLKNKELSGISLHEHMPLLNQVFKALRKKALYVIGAPEKTGKSSIMLHIAMILAYFMGVPVAYADTEMEYEEVLLRMVSKISGVKEDNISNDILTPEEENKVNQAWDIVEKLPFYHFNANNLDNGQLESRVKELQLKYGIQLFVYDYVKIQKHETDKGRADLVLAAKIDTLKESIAKQCDIPVITSGQMRLDEQTKKWKFWETSHFGKLADVICVLYKVDKTDPLKTGSTHEIALIDGRKVKQDLIGKPIAYNFEQDIHHIQELHWADGGMRGKL